MGTAAAHRRQRELRPSRDAPARRGRAGVHPTSGGGVILGHLTDTAIDSGALVRDVMRPTDGACIVFEGVVRNHHEGKQVQSIFYDAYRPMAEKEIDTILSGIAREFPDVAVGVRHRLGHLIVGDVSITIVCASPHRAEAYSASRAVIDRIKETVPIWKKEKGPSGEEWVGLQGRGL